ncbi:MAG TPA: M56 family metallopeptidase [Vicinamibacterales bacterium]|nr:M56 family metallopeptidase [Vicinamibacterales bacterium]
MIDALAWTLLHFLWQGALLGLIAFLLLRLARPDRASTRYAIGVATLGLMLVTSIATFAQLSKDAPPPIVRSPVTVAPIRSAASSSVDETVSEVTKGGTSQSMIRTNTAVFATWRPAPLGTTTTSLLVLAWAIGVLALSLRLLGGWMLTRSLTRHAVSSVSPAIIAAAGAIAARLELRRAVRIVESGAVVVPTLVGWIKPVVLLPAAALSGLSPEQLQAILAHELAHVRRHDYLVNLLQSMIETLLFYHPAMWWVSSQVRAEREHCCDDLAVEVCGDRLIYVTALAELTTIASHRAFALAATDGSIVARVRRILGRPRAMHEPTPAWAVLALFVLIFGSIGSFRAETHAAVIPKAATITQKAAPPIATAPVVKRDEHEKIAASIATTTNPPSAKLFESRADAFFKDQWFRNWFDSTPPPPPQPPRAPEAPSAPEAPPAPPAPPAPFVRGVSSGPEAPPAPGAPGAPVAPAAPVAPTAPAPPPPPPAPQELGSHGSGNMSWQDGNDKITVKWSGGFRLSDDEKDISWMEDGATLSIADGVVFVDRLELRGVNGRIERTFSKNGTRRDYEPEGRQFLAAAIDKLIKGSGLFAKERVAKFLKRGGPDAVMAEIARLGASSYTHRIYYSELARQAELSESLLSRILQRAPVEMTSDYDKATLFTEIVKQPSITEAHRVQIARAVKTINSDYDQRRTLAAIMEITPLTSSIGAAVLEATASIASNYDRAEVLTQLVERGGVTRANAGTFADLAQSMTSSYDKRRVLTALVSQRQVPAEVLEHALNGSLNMGSYDQSETLIKLIEGGGLTDSSADAFFKSAAQISSSYDLSRVLRKAADQPSVNERIIEGILRAAAKISSSHDRANLLEAVASRHKVTGTSRQLYVDATNGMGSFDGNRALAALVRSER